MKLMFMVDLLGWWYVRGWSWAAKYLLITRNQHVVEFFSVGAVAKTLFAPYRQSYAGGVRGTLGDKLRGFVDTTISRLIGFIVRLALLFAAGVALTVNTIGGALGLVLWPLVPLSPICAIVLFLMGVGL